jgi:hypothetical protein
MAGFLQTVDWILRAKSAEENMKVVGNHPAFVRLRK